MAYSTNSQSRDANFSHVEIKSGVTRILIPHQGMFQSPTMFKDVYLIVKRMGKRPF